MSRPTRRRRCLLAAPDPRPQDAVGFAASVLGRQRLGTGKCIAS
jgi:hypothetical protein